MENFEINKELFQFPEEALIEYPFLQGVNLSDEQKKEISAVIINNRAVRDCIPKIDIREPNIDIERVSDIAKEALEIIKEFVTDDSELADLIKNETKLLEKNTEATRNAIGNKKRDMSDMGRYK